MADATSLRPGSLMRVVSSQTLRIVQQRRGLRLADPQSMVRRLAVDPLLDGVELADPFQRLARQRRCAACGVDVVELAPDVCPAGGLHDQATLIQSAEPGIAVGLQHAAKPRQVRPRVLAAAVRRVAIAHCRRRRAGIGSLVAQVGPEPTGAGLARARRQHRDRCVVGVQDAQPPGHGARVPPPAAAPAPMPAQPNRRESSARAPRPPAHRFRTGGRAAGGRRIWPPARAPAARPRHGRDGSAGWVRMPG